MTSKQRRLAGYGVCLLVGSIAVLMLVTGGWRWGHPQTDMVKTLAALVAEEGTWDNPWDLQDKKTRSLEADIEAEHNAIRRLILRRELAQQYVGEGVSGAAIGILEQLLAEYDSKIPHSDIEILKADLAFAYFRMGELTNCSWNHNADVCIFPIQGDGVHKQQLGATEAARQYAALLADPATNPENALLYRWMLNICHMVLGTYPEGVPTKWLIPEEAFASDYDIGKFRDVAAGRGLVSFGRAGGIVVEDFANNGHLDVMISHMGLEEQVEYFRNNGDRKFTLATEEAGLKGITGGLNMVQADYNNDGCIDVLITRGAWLHDHGQHPLSLLRNNCDGTFTDVTVEAGILNNYPTQTAVWADFNNDGLLDLFIGNEIVREKVQWPDNTPNFRLYINNGDGTFTDVAPETGIDVRGMIKGAAADDYNRDGWQDLFVSVMGGPKRLFRNAGTKGKIPKFVDVSQQAGIEQPNMSFTCWFFDYNNDGWPDIFVSGYWATMPNIVREYIGEKERAKGDRPRLYRNNRDGTFTDVSRETHIDKLLLTMGANFGDLDNDGWPDFYLGTGAAPLNNIVPNRMFHNHEGKYFDDVTTSGGFGHLQKGHGVAFADIDNDGNQDILAVMGGAFTADKFWPVLFKNPGHGNHWIKLNLVGVHANRFAIGATIRVRIREDGNSRDIYHTVSSGGIFGATTLRPHIGLGKATEIDELEIRWPGSGLVETVKGPVPADASYELREGEGTLKLLHASSAQFSTTARP